MNMPTTFETVIDHFRKNNWSFQVAEGRPVLSAGFRGKNGVYRLVAAVEESDDLLQALGVLPLVVPTHKLAAVSELCVRLSHNLKMGRFELNYADGELRFQTSSAYAAGDLKTGVIQRVIGVNLTMIDQHFPAFIAVLYTDVPPETAAEHIRALIAKGEPTGAVNESHLAGRIRLN